MQSEPDRHFFAVDSVVLGKRRERHQAAMRRSEPSLPVNAADIPDVRRAAVRLHPEQFLEVDGLALGLQFLRALLRRVHQGPLRARHAPARHDDLASTGCVPHDRRGVIRKDAGH